MQAETDIRRRQQKLFRQTDSEGPLHPQDKEEVRARLDKLREVANLSARTAVKTHTWKRFRGIVVAKIVIGLGTFIVGGLMFISKFWTDAALASCAWLVITIGVIALMELFHSVWNLFNISIERKETPSNDAEGEASQTQDDVDQETS